MTFLSVCSYCMVFPIFLSLNKSKALASHSGFGW
jgi:hypothetical protein